MPTAIGAYIFAGGFTVGVKQAGFDVLCHLEGDGGYGVSTARLNWPDLPCYFGPDRWPLGDLPSPDFIYANPPCAPFSSMGIRITHGGQGAWRNDPRISCWRDSFNLVEKLRPRTWACESVTQIYTDGREMVDDMTKRALMGGYSVTHLLIDASWMGLPQKRKRFFLVLHKPPSIASLATSSLNWAPPPTVGEVLTEVDDPGLVTPTPERLVPVIAEAVAGEGLTDAFDRLYPDRPKINGKIAGRPSFSGRKVPIDGQIGAFIGNSLFHHTEPRLLGSNEHKAICGYPQDFQLDGPEGGRSSLLARAVMPPVGRWLAGIVLRSLDLPDGTWEDRRVTLVDLRKPNLAPEDLTSQYLDQNGRVRFRLRIDGTIGAASAAAPVRVKEAKGSQPPSPAPKAGGNQPDPPPRVSPTSPVLVGGNGSAFPEPPPGWDAHRPLPGEGSGKFIQRMWKTTDLSPDELVMLVHSHWAGRKTVKSDVYYNYRRLLDAGEQVRPWPRSTVKQPRVERGLAAPSQSVAPRPSPRRSGPRLVLTGFSTAQAKRRTKAYSVEKIDVPAALAAELEEQGAQLDWSPGTFGQERPFDGAIVCLGLAMSIHGVQNAANALWTLAVALKRQVPVIVFFDDWKITTMTKHLQYVRGHQGAGPAGTRLWKYGIGVEEADYDRHREELLEVIVQLLEGYPSQWSAMFPRYQRWGDQKIAESLVPTTRFLSLDPTPAVIDLSQRFEEEQTDAWFLATLGDHAKWLDEVAQPSWPVTKVGYLRGGQQRLSSELEVRREGAKHRGVLAPPYDLSGSGWFRARFVYAALDGSALSAGEADRAALGEAYQRATIREVETRTLLRELVNYQAETLLPLVSRERAEFNETVSTIMNTLTGKVSYDDLDATAQTTTPRQGSDLPSVQPHFHRDPLPV